MWGVRVLRADPGSSRPTLQPNPNIPILAHNLGFTASEEGASRPDQKPLSLWVTGAVLTGL